MEVPGSETCVQLPRGEAIAQLNDRLRKTGKGGTIVVTRGVMALTDFSQSALTQALADYDEFDASGDPHGERDFGCLTYLGAELLWKIDYYDRNLEFGSDDPADEKVTQRVLTVMLASEW